VAEFGHLHRDFQPPLVVYWLSQCTFQPALVVYWLFQCTFQPPCQAFKARISDRFWLSQYILTSFKAQDVARYTPGHPHSKMPIYYSFMSLTDFKSSTTLFHISANLLSVFTISIRVCFFVTSSVHSFM
jgi:hypothetical protein